MRLELLPCNNPPMFPVLALRDAMEGRLRIDLELPGRSLRRDMLESDVSKGPDRS